MKLLVGLNNKNFLDYLNYTNSFIIGLKDFSINYQEFTIDEIRKIRKDYPNIEIFVSMNKNIFNDDLLLLENMLIELNDLNIAGVLFYDLSILSICNRLNLSIPLVWAQEHMTTNYNTCNYYYEKGCKYVYLSSEITSSEIKEIKEHSKIKLMSFFYGYPDVSFSKRKLLTNYFLYHHKEKENEWYTIGDENSDYFIKENNLGTRILYGKVMNGIKAFDELRDTVHYAILSSELMEPDVFIKGLSIYKDLLDNKIDKEEAFHKIYEITGSMDSVFYDKKTIYKVKDEK